MGAEMRTTGHCARLRLAGILLGLLCATSLSAQDAVQSASGQQAPKRIDWNSYFQLRYTGIEDAPDGYSLRRFKLIFRGRLQPDVEYFVQGIFKDGNHSSTDGRAYLQEAWIKYSGWKYANLTLGQFKPPFSLERFTPDYKLETIDRAQATDHLVPDGQLGGSYSRDRGAQLDAWLVSRRLYYAVGIFDGNGANNPWHGNSPLLVGQVRGVLYRSPAKRSRKDQISLGGAFSTRHDHSQDFSSTLPGTSALGYSQFAGRDTHFNIEASANFSPFSLRSEYFYARYEPSRAMLVAVHASGFYVQGGYDFSRHYQAVAKYETLNPNRAVVDSHDMRWTTLGFNWRIQGDRLRVGADYVIKRELRQQVPNNALLLQFQMFLH